MLTPLVYLGVVVKVGAALMNCAVFDRTTIKGGIKAESARLAVTLEGSITARELVILRSAKILGDVQYDALTIEQGAQVEGRFAPQGAEKQKAAPAKKPASNNEDEPKLIVSN